MADVQWSDEAVQQVDLIVAYIKLFDPAAAERMGAKLFALGESLADFPNRVRPARHETREMTTVPPYVLTYEVQADMVTILSIRHGAPPARLTHRP